MAFVTRPFGFSTNTEVEASSFSVWNCVITFLQILLISTILYGSGWSQGELYNVSPENFSRFYHFRTIAFFFCVWALQSVALALLLVWAIGKRSYHLCHSWVLCETLMQIFIILSSIYFVYRSALLHKVSESSFQSLSDSNDKANLSGTNSSPQNFSHSFVPPRHYLILIMLHFLIKGFGFWIVWRYMKLLRTTSGQLVLNETNDSSGTPNEGMSQSCSTSHQISPPPSYAYLCKDDLPCYDEALKLCLKDSVADIDRKNLSEKYSQAEAKNTLAPV